MATARPGFDIQKTTVYVLDGRFPYAASTVQGFRRAQEDRYAIYSDLPGSLHSAADGPNALFAIYDGHRGPSMAEYASKTLHKALLRSEHYNHGRYGPALTEAFLRMDDDVRAGKVPSLTAEEEDKNYPNAIGDSTISGCTATVALYNGTQIWVASAGDSRAILCRNGSARPLSRDHNPFDPREIERIEAAGSKVIRGKVGMTINITRALGDISTKYRTDLPPERQAITCVPDVFSSEITSEDEFLVLISDGVWNALYNKHQLYQDKLKEYSRASSLAHQVSQVVDGKAINDLAQDELCRAVAHLPPQQALDIYLAGEEMSNQNVCDIVRWCIARELPLEKICECILDFCLENHNGNDNASIMIVPLLQGQSLTQWYHRVSTRVRSGVGRSTPGVFPPYQPREGGSASLNDIVSRTLGV